MAKTRDNITQSYGAFQRYPRNAWYIAAGRSEIGRTPLGRRLLGKDVVMFRKEDGTAVVMDDHCPHRGFRLSKSRIVGDRIQCGYHGMEFNEHGQCVKIAGAGAVPNVMRVKSYPLVEKWHWAWIWMGDPEKADPATIPVFEGEDEPDYEHSFVGCVPFAGNWQLGLDNQLDFTHATFLHSGILDNADTVEFTQFTPVFQADGRFMSLTSDMPGYHLNQKTIDFFRLPFKVGDRVNRRVMTVFHLPCALTVYSRFYEYQPDFGPDNLGTLVTETIAAIGMTPADPSNSYQFIALTTPYPQQESDGQANLYVINQDVEAFEMMQEHYERDPDAVEISVASDKPGIISRRFISNLVQDEDGII